MKTLLRIAFALVLTAALTEAGIRIYRSAIGQPPPHPDPSVAEEWEWAQDHLEAGAPSIGSQARPDPLLGWRASPRRRAAVGGPKRVGRARTPGIPRVVLVGDSFTRELGALRERFEGSRTFQPGWEVVNLAVQGFGVGQAWLRYREDGVGYRGDVAILGFYLRDYFRTFRSFRSFAKPTFALVDGELRVEHVPVPTPEALYEAYRSGERRIGRPGRSWVLDFVRQQREALNRRSDLRGEQFAVFTAILESFRDEALRGGACPALVIFPTRPEDYYGTVYEELDLRARDAAHELGMPWLALAEPLYRGVAPADRERFFGRGNGAHMSDYGRHEVDRALDAAFERYHPDACFAAAPDGSLWGANAPEDSRAGSAG